MCRVNIQRNNIWSENERILTYWFDLGSVQFPPVEHDGVDGVTCPSGLDGSWEHIQEILEEEKGERKVNRTDAHETIIHNPQIVTKLTQACLYTVTVYRPLVQTKGVMILSGH